MRTTPKSGGRSSSLWLDVDVPSFDRPPPPETDICIVGAGIAGLTTAFELARRGARVTVLDDGPIGGGETARTSAHLASAVDDRYSVLEQRFGAGGAQIVAESHKTAIDYIEAMVRERGIDCEFQRVDGFLIQPPGHQLDKHRILDRELAAAQRAGLDCTMVDSAPLPFDTGPAIRFANQAEFHPMKYLRGLAEGVLEMHGNIYTGVHVVGIEPGEPLRVKLADGHMMFARVVIDCTNGAMSSFVHMHLRQAAYRTYCVAFALPHDTLPHALVWDTADPYHYVRVASSANGDVLIVGGGDHRVGHGEAGPQWKELEAWTREWIPVAGEVVAQWSGQVIEPADGPAHIGRSPDLEHVYICTGDSGNGLTHGTIAGLMIPEMLSGHHPRWERVYDPRRNHLHAVGTLLREAVGSSAPYLDWLKAGDVGKIDDIPRGEGALVRRGLHMVAAYRDEAGTCHLMSATCPHLRGVVQWNGAEKTWDCPCHGSRFDRYGVCVNGPAQTNLEPLEAPAHDRAPIAAREDQPRELTPDGLPYVPIAPLERER
jgi:glycine/D-amino acid oxidase-like deaminating enzyme/nitrite reductase/ring-hydroxylating ferredoxin subunit